MNERQLGLLFSAFFWTYTLTQIPVGWLAERYGAHRILAAGLTLWAVATMCVGVAHTFPVLLGLRLLLGIGESVAFPSVSKLLAAGGAGQEPGHRQRCRGLRLLAGSGRRHLRRRPPHGAVRMARGVLGVRRPVAAVVAAVVAGAGEVRSGGAPQG